MAEDDYSYTPENRFSENPLRKRILKREAFFRGAEPNADFDDICKTPVGLPEGTPLGSARYWLIRRPQVLNIFATVQFKVRVGWKEDGLPKGYMAYSGLPLQKWLYKKENKTTGVVSLRISDKYPPDGDALAQFVKYHRDLICPKIWKGSILTFDGTTDPKLDFDEVFAVEAFEVLFNFEDVKDTTSPSGWKRQVKRDAAGKIMYQIIEFPWVLEMRRSWFNQYRDRVLMPPKDGDQVAIAPVEDDGGAPKAKPAPQKWLLPTTDKTQVLLRFVAKVGNDPKKGIANVNYQIEPHETLAVPIPAGFTVSEPLPEKEGGIIDWHKVYVPFSDKDAQRLVERSEKQRSPETEEQAPPPPPPPDEPAAEASHGAASDDIPF